jgi:hypothetical protein
MVPVSKTPTKEPKMTLNRYGQTTDTAAVRAATVEAIEAGGGATAGEYDIDTIVDAQVTYARENDGAEMDTDDFWTLIQANAR